MDLHTIEILNGIVTALTTALPTATVSREMVDIDQLCHSKGDFPRAMVLWGGGDQTHRLGRSSADEDLEVVLVLYVHDDSDPESALMALFKPTLSALATGLVVNVGGQDVEHFIDLTGRYTTDRQSAKPFGWLVKKVSIRQRFTV